MVGKHLHLSTGNTRISTFKDVLGFEFGPLGAMNPTCKVLSHREKVSPKL